MKSKHPENRRENSRENPREKSWENPRESFGQSTTGGKNSSGSSSDGRRTQRVEKELQAIVSRFLMGSYKGEIPGLLTVTQVKVPPNLRSAQVYVSVLNGTKEQQELAIGVLEKRKGEIQTYIHRQLPMKHTPVLHFHTDQGMERSLRIDSILREIDQNRKHE